MARALAAGPGAILQIVQLPGGFGPVLQYLIIQNDGGNPVVLTSEAMGGLAARIAETMNVERGAWFTAYQLKAVDWS